MGRNRRIRRWLQNFINSKTSTQIVAAPVGSHNAVAPPPPPLNPNTCTQSGKVLGSGTFGVVIEGTYVDNISGIHDVAIKMCNSLSEQDAYDALKNELQVFNKVQEGHPNVVHCFGGNLGGSWDLGKGHLNEIAMEGEEYFLVEELMCSNLASLMTDGGFREDWTYGDICRLFMGIASGLEFLHNHNIVHYDLKPANVLLDEACTPKLADFGASTIRLRQSLTAHFKGTPGYMAPEVCLAGYANLRINHRLDIYSMGVMMWECVSGLRANEAGCTETTKEHVAQLGETWFVVDESCPKELQQLIAECLHFSTIGYSPDFTRPDCSEVYSRLESMLSAPWAADKPILLKGGGGDGRATPLGAESRQGCKEARNMGMEGEDLSVTITGRQQSNIFFCVEVGQILDQQGKYQDVFVRYSRDESMHERFRSELTLFQTLPPHDNLVQCFGPWCKPTNGQERSIPMIVHERLTCSLDTFLVSCRGSSKFVRGSPEFNRTLCGIWKGVASGLAHLHAHSVVFQGLCLNSVFVSANFNEGIVHAVKLGSLTSAERTEGDTFFLEKVEFNFGYMAPEAEKGLASSDVCLTMKIDVFSLGVLIWCSINEEAQGCWDLGDLDAQGEGYHEGVVQLVKKCVEKDPADRPTCAEILEMIDTIETELDWEIINY